MSDFKIGPTTGPAQQPVDGHERASPTEGGKSFELSSELSSTQDASSPVAVDPASLVQNIREGQLDIEGAVEILVEEALRSKPLVGASEALRREVLLALTDLVRDDPTLASLSSALKR